MTLTAFSLSATVAGQVLTEPPASTTSRDAFDSFPVAPTEPTNGSRFAQPQGRLRLSPRPSPAPVVDGNTGDYAWLLKQLQQKRKQAIANVRAQQQATANDYATGEDDHRRIHELRRNYEDQDSQLQDREERVNRQLDRLERILKEHEVLDRSNRAAPPNVDPSTRESTPDPTEPQENPQPSEMITKPIAAPSNPDESEPSDGIVDDEAPAETSPAFSPSQVDAIALTNQTVDSLALANNLYGTGEYSLALKIYSKITQSEMLQEDKIWIRFQIANCHRRLGNFKEAQRGYRVVTTAAADSWMGDTAHWWLDTTTKTARLQDRITRLQASYEQLRKEVDEPIAEP